MAAKARSAAHQSLATAASQCLPLTSEISPEMPFALAASKFANSASPIGPWRIAA